MDVLTERVKSEYEAIDAANRFLTILGSQYPPQKYVPEYCEVFKVQEVPCGWVCEWSNSDWVESWRKGNGRGDPSLSIIGLGNEQILVNRWSGNTSFIRAGLFGDFPNLEAALRNHYKHLSIQEQSALSKYSHLEPFAPIRFYPPVLEIGEIDNLDQVQGYQFSVYYDERILKGSEVPMPPELFDNVGTLRTINLISFRKINENWWEAQYSLFFDKISIQGLMGSLRNRIQINANYNQLTPSWVSDSWVEIHGRVIPF